MKGDIYLINHNCLVLYLILEGEIRFTTCIINDQFAKLKFAIHVDKLIATYTLIY